MTAIECTADNAAEFNARLRDELPEFHAFAAALHRAGMIDGLRHARIAPPPEGLPGAPSAVVPQTSLAAETRIADRRWASEQAAKAGS